MLNVTIFIAFDFDNFLKINSALVKPIGTYKIQNCINFENYLNVTKIRIRKHRKAVFPLSKVPFLKKTIKHMFTFQFEFELGVRSELSIKNNPKLTQRPVTSEWNKDKINILRWPHGPTWLTTDYNDITTQCDTCLGTQS